MVLLAIVDSLLISLIMLGFGYRFSIRPPRNVNMWYGYRTEMSMKNSATWDFAHRWAGRVWMRSSLVCALFSTLFIIAFWRSPQFEYLVLVLVLIQMVILMAVIPITERELHRRFDRDGKPRR